MDFLNFSGKNFLIFGLANKKSIAYYTGKTLEAFGANVFYSVRSEKRKAEVTKFVKSENLFVCDVEEKYSVQELAEKFENATIKLDGMLHSIAFANFSAGFKQFHETQRDDFLQAVTISCFSLTEIANAFKNVLTNNASVVTIGISSQVTAEQYGYMSPIKAALESSVRFLAKSFSKTTKIRFNCVGAGPLKTSASAGIPGFLKNYLFAEKLTLRKTAITTQEVANTAAFLLSEKSSGINGQSIVVNAGMDFNYFDDEIVNKVIG